MDKQILISLTLLCNYIFNLYNNNLFFNIIKKLNSRSDKEWYYIHSYSHELPILIEDINKELKKIRKVNLSKVKFIDVGCGVPVIGEIISLTTEILSKNIYGLEHNKSVIDMITINTVCSSKDIVNNIIEGDLLEYDKFKQFGIFYSYNPLKSETDMVEGLKNIIKQMKKGSIFYFNNACVSYVILEKLGFIYLDKNSRIYKYVKE